MKRTVEPRPRKTGFVRRSAPDNPKILVSHCPYCKKQIAGAPTKKKLHAAEHCNAPS